jgi:hypothetical protein
MKNRFGFPNILLALLISPQSMDAQPEVIQFTNLSHRVFPINSFLAYCKTGKALCNLDLYWLHCIRV